MLNNLEARALWSWRMWKKAQLHVDYFTDNVKELVDRFTEDVAKNTPEDMIDACCIYGIYIDDILVYIGQTKHYVKRLAEHQLAMYYIGTSCNEHKYEILAQAKKEGHKVGMRILQEVSEADLNDYEAAYINEYYPPLNTIIPGGKRNSYAKCISLDEILYKEEEVAV